MVDARLADGSRVNAIIPPLALDGPALSIRRFSEVPYTMEKLISFGTLTREMALILAALVKSKLNILVSGGTGSGKTTLLNIMSGFIPETERIITIEDAAELRLQQAHVVRLETRPPNLEGKGEINQRALVKNSLRMRPDRIVVGEVRGAEVLDMLQAMNTGHDGSLTTIHANSSRDALTRIENMVGLTGLPVVQKSLRQQMASAIAAVVHTARLSDGRRKVMSIDEVLGMEGDIITMQEIYSYKQTGVEADGKVLGKFVASGIRPRFADTVAARGSPLPDSLFLNIHN
jgi:pilus assembly protein CpaF